ncbi:MAG: thioredoxin domain-containing protein, partial [Candidatus Diapherotrites archaeon]|nr:thioredoxin domain-containing protein [Candidatus Diapherotrites archaeon]
DTSLQRSIGGSATKPLEENEPSLSKEELRQLLVEAEIELTEYCSYTDSFCKTFHATTFKELMRDYGDLFSYRFVLFSLKQPDNDFLAAQAAKCAGEQDAFFEMHGKLFSASQAIDSALAKEIAAEIGLNSTAFSECMESEKYLNQIQNEYSNALAAKTVTGIPSFLVNNRLVKGMAKTLEFEKVFTEIASGKTPIIPVDNPQAEATEGIKVCSVTGNGIAECATIKEIRIEPAPKEVIEATATTSVQPIEVEFNIAQTKERIKISKTSNATIVLEDKEGKSAEISEPIQIDANGLKVKGKQIQIMPGDALQKAREKTSSTAKEIKLKVVGEKPVYEIKAVQNARLLWFIPIEMQIKTVVNAQTGGIESVEKPWWSFLFGG